MNEVSEYLEKLTKATRQSESEVLARAVNRGLRQLWREHLLGLFLRGEISREDTVEQVGIDWVELAERQHRAMIEDVQWGLKE